MLEKKSSNYCDVAPLEQTTFTTVILKYILHTKKKEKVDCLLLSKD